jgi:hypothetical protein
MIQKIELAVIAFLVSFALANSETTDNKTHVSCYNNGIWKDSASDESGLVLNRNRAFLTKVTDDSRYLSVYYDSLKWKLRHAPEDSGVIIFQKVGESFTLVFFRTYHGAKNEKEFREHMEKSYKEDGIKLDPIIHNSDQVNGNKFKSIQYSYKFRKHLLSNYVMLYSSPSLSVSVIGQCKLYVKPQIHMDMFELISGLEIDSGN